MDAGDQFADPSVVAAYARRPPIPAPVLDRLIGLLPSTPRNVLDAGCGTGAVAAALAPVVDRVDAVDPSAAMIAEGRRRSAGTPNIDWIHATMEDAVLRPPYGLIACAGSLHWMDLAVVLPRFASVLASGGTMAVLFQREVEQPWTAGLRALTMRYSTNRDAHRYGMFQRLAEAGDFEVRGQYESQPVPHVQPVDDYIESIHSRSGCSRERMSSASQAAFDREARALLERYVVNRCLPLRIIGQMMWGRPGRNNPRASPPSRS
ncbi:methyltransferase domain-containing protein [Actinopolymorpha sp. B11F2]|uniref:class I SAM-dependent methyltransferase n=1 Tax=Actinopolymorpha sp. B11F2 TaxID=3160862 RepID=UPI0032E51B79